MMSSIDEARYPCRRQRLGWLCIPAAIENVLVYLGEQGWTQERILGEWYLWRTGDRDQWPRLDICQTQDESFWERFLPTRLELESPAKALDASVLGARFSFGFRPCESSEEAVRIIRQRLECPANALPTIASRSAQSGAHMAVVVGFDEASVRCHDPGFDEVHQMRWEQFTQGLGAHPHLLLIDPR